MGESDSSTSGHGNYAGAWDLVPTYLGMPRCVGASYGAPTRRFPFIDGVQESEKSTAGSRTNSRDQACDPSAHCACLCHSCKLRTSAFVSCSTRKREYKTRPEFQDCSWTGRQVADRLATHNRAGS